MKYIMPIITSLIAVLTLYQSLETYYSFRTINLTAKIAQEQAILLTLYIILTICFTIISMIRFSMITINNQVINKRREAIKKESSRVIEGGAIIRNISKN